MHPPRFDAKYNGNREVFSGWKDIANYLGKGTRTVQRYERALRLPVRRPAGKTGGAVLAIKSELDLWVLSASMRPSPERLHIPLRVAENEMQKLQKGVAQMRTLRQETSELRAEVSVLRETFSQHLQLVRASLLNQSDLNQSKKSNVPFIDSVANRAKPPLGVKKPDLTCNPATAFEGGKRVVKRGFMAGS